MVSAILGLYSFYIFFLDCAKLSLLEFVVRSYASCLEICALEFDLRGHVLEATTGIRRKAIIRDYGSDVADNILVGVAVHSFDTFIRNFL